MIWYRRAIFVFSGCFVADRAGAARRHGRSTAAASSGSSSARSSSPSGSAGSSWSASVARKVRGFERVLDAPALFAVAYDEIGSSIYFALGIVAAQALGLTPVVLLATGLLFLVVSLSYAEGTAAIPETGGAATFTRRAFNDLVGFVTGWVLFLDYLIVIALSTLFLPHYLAASLSAPSLDREPVGRDDRDRRHRRSSSARGSFAARRSTSTALVLALLDIAVQMLVVVLGFACVFSPGVLVERLRLRDRPELARPLLRAAARDARLHRASRRSPTSPRRRASPAGCCPRSLFTSIGLVVIMTVLIAIVGAVRLPGRGRLDRPRRRLAAGADRRHRDRVRRAPARRRSSTCCAIVVGLSGALILFAAATTAITGCTRLGRSMAEHGMLPREFGRLERRSLVSREAILATGGVAIAIVVVDGDLRQGRPGLPRERLLVRRALRVHRRAARGDPAAPHGARPRAAVPGEARGADPRRPASRCRR